MRRKTAYLVLAAVLLIGVAEAGMPRIFRSRAADGGTFPNTGDVPNLVRVGKPVTYRREKFVEFYGSPGNRYIQYGMINMMVGEYTYGGDGRRVTIELATMETPDAAAGLFHHHRGKVLAGRGTPAAVGAEGVLDSGRGGRTLYFYRANIFAKVVYGGKEPVPDMTPIARYLDSRMPDNRDDKPDGFAYIDVPGVNKDTIELTPGFALNISFLPPAVTASAPAGGSVASDLLIITRSRDGDAAELYRDYTSYLRLHAEYHEEYQRGRQKFMKAVDPSQGRVVVTAYRNAFIIAARPDGYEKGEALIDQVMTKIDELRPQKGRR